MTIHLPYPDFRRSAKCLSDDHLRAQRSFVRDAIQAITIPGRLAKRGVDVVIWEGHITQLLEICEATLEERRRRGADERGVTPWMLDHKTQPPHFIGDALFHRAAKLALLKADPAHYGKMKWSAL